jgi:hypothetical protein
MASSIKGTTEESLTDVVDNVKDVFKFCEESGLTIEVIATALIILKENPKYQIEYALHAAMQDWDI